MIADIKSAVEIIAVGVDRFRSAKSTKKQLEDLDLYDKIGESEFLSEDDKKAFCADFFTVKFRKKHGFSLSRKEAQVISEAVISPEDSKFEWRTVKQALPYFVKENGLYIAEISFSRRQTFWYRLKACLSMISLTCAMLWILMLIVTFVKSVLGLEVENTMERLIDCLAYFGLFFGVGFLIFLDELPYLKARHIQRFLNGSDLEAEPSVLFFDGDCGLCNQFVIRVLEHDLNKEFMFCSLQSDYAQSFLGDKGVTIDLSTMYVYSSEEIYARSDAALLVWKHIYPRMRFLCWLCRLIPRCLRDIVYKLIARNRHKLIKSNSCVLMKPEWRERFLDMADLDQSGLTSQVGQV